MVSMIPEKDDGKDFDDCPLVVVPDDVSDGFQRVQEPHERRIRSPARGYWGSNRRFKKTFSLKASIFYNKMCTLKHAFSILSPLLQKGMFPRKHLFGTSL